MAEVVAALGAGRRAASGSTPTTTPAAASPTRWPPCSRARRTSRAPINGYGERCGNANLISIIPNLQLKLGYECLTDAQLASLTPTANYIAELLNFTPDPDSPYVGRNAFAHKGGMHVAGVSADPATFEHIAPEVVGNRREMLISELSGKGTVQSRAREAGIELDDARPPRRWWNAVKELEHRGYHYEAADGSFELLLRKETGEYEPLFRLESWRAIVEKRADGRVETEATIKIWVGGRALRAHRRGQRSGQRAGPGAARGAGRDPSRTCATSSWSTSRSGSSTRPRGPAPSPACCSTSPTATACGARSACRRT